MQDLKIAIIQSSLKWEDIQANLDVFREKIGAIDGKPDLIVLPEMFTTGFTMNAAALAADMEGMPVRWMTEMAEKSGAAVAGSMIIREGAFLYNRLIWAAPGALHYYDKRHLFRMAGEERVFAPGNRAIVIEHRGWRISPFICYDLRFPCWSRNFSNGFDCALYVANWPAKRSGHWKALLAARAIENQCYVLGCNRVGADGNGAAHKGESAVIDPRGSIIAMEGDRECVISASLSYDGLARYREEFPVWRDADIRK